MAAIFADAAVFGFKALSKESPAAPPEDKPSCVVAEPWRPQDACPCTRPDFIIFAEFSEVLGPVPLLTIPARADQAAGIEINNFIMRIMSVDYQANSSQSIFCEDAQVLQMSVIPGIHAYVHYLTLHDPVARGFVRPLCLAYVSADQCKLSDLFPQLREQFLKLSQLMKHDNRLWFREEISSVLRCIKETQHEYLYWKKIEEDGGALSAEERQLLQQTNMDHLVQQSTDYTHMLHAVMPLLKAEAGTNDTLLGHWKCGFARADKADLILSALGSQHGAKTSSGNYLKCVLGLSPWGLPVALWNLLVLLRKHRQCRLKHKSGDDDQVTLHDNVDDALNDPEYLELINLLVNHSEPKTVSQPVDYVSCLDVQEAGLMSGGNEVASSYHSVPESLSEILTGIRLAGGEEARPDVSSNSSNDSFLDISETSSVNDDNWSEPSPEQANGNKSPCAWTCHRMGSGVLKFFQTYDKVAHHVMYSLLISRTVVFAGGQDAEQKASRLMNTLSAYVPGQDVKILRWHCGILVPSHISCYHMIGVCVPERLSVHDMISSKDKNSVTILDVSSKQLFGPAYSGQLLASLERSPQYMPSDQSLMLFLRSVAAGINGKLFMYLTLAKTKETSEVLRDLGLGGCDAEIVRNLGKIGSISWST